MTSEADMQESHQPEEWDFPPAPDAPPGDVLLEQDAPSDPEPDTSPDHDSLTEQEPVEEQGPAVEHEPPAEQEPAMEQEPRVEQGALIEQDAPAEQAPESEPAPQPASAAQSDAAAQAEPVSPAEDPSPKSLRERIYEWSLGLAPWQRDLLRRLAHGPLSAEDEKEVMDVITGTLDAPSPQPLELDDLPAEEIETGAVQLREISNVQNVNLLAEDQTLSFKPGANVVFGGTGAGKSGYGRLLRRLCRTIEHTEVLRNAFDASSESRQQTASVRIEVDGEAREIDVDLEAEPNPVFSAMTVFDAGRAPVYVSEPNVIEHVPPPLSLLRRLAEAQEALRGQLKERVMALRGKLPRLPEIDPSTPAGQLVASITAETGRAQVEGMAELSVKERAEINELEAASPAIASKQSRELEAAARARAHAAEAVAGELERAAEKLIDGRLKEVADLRARFDEATEAERSLATEAFSGQAFNGTGQGPWREMWEAARRFVEVEGGTFPSTQPGAACPVCEQSLDEGARERMQKFEEFVRSDLGGRLAALTRDLSRAVNELPDVKGTRALVEASLAGAPDEIVATANEVLDGLAARASFARSCAEGEASDLGAAPDLPAVAPIRTYADEQASAAATQAALRDESSQQLMVKRLAELRAREQLAAALPAILERIAALQEIALLKGAISGLITSRISSQLRKLQEDVVTDRLRAAVIEELEAFDLLPAAINVAGKAARGRTTVEFWLRGGAPERVRIGEVLSEGEQRALALSFFLAESGVTGARSAIVLDDPAALLDHERREHVAKRLIREAQHRQVIVFTHDLAFVQMLQRTATAEDRELHGQALQRAFGRTGVPSKDGFSRIALDGSAERSPAPAAS